MLDLEKATDAELEVARKRADASIQRSKARRDLISKERLRRRKAKECPHNRYSNLHCLAEINHGGPHLIPCADRGSHRAHRDFSPARNTLTDCHGRTFDAT